ncbi:substrate-binding domain-containing protein [Nocardioides sp. cx-173]|uniref:substrate-binding domain-containing protein n=1 Tax=Nocardioides sp. cx-173 TaxID=2898796 RepID=UPI001E413EE1|nr:substrate-binding domain-containing protein [Nocardioides sp. cx-173]MCD4524813.1 substrate-binding domain-containing protein [Nocardioides sp. cx-173]UGB43319.1 substrate-binding domain-containing protein [Nocardioides sp. cx-173]
MPARSAEMLSVALVVPLQGPTGLYGPSCLACAELAAEQLNERDGIAGRQVELVVVDAGREPRVVADEVGRLVDEGRVQAVAGWHISAVRQAITRRVGGRVVYAFAAMHEGGDATPGVYMIGERPINQLLPAAHWMREELAVGRWAIVGNDYVFPRVTGATARLALADTTSEVVSETYVPLGTSDFGAVIESLSRQPVDGVMMLLMGQDAVHFNRQFARAGLSALLPRLSPAVEENTLLAGGAGAHEGLYAAAAYFDALGTAESTELARAYYARWGRWAPTLNAVGESCYEALYFLARVGEVCGSVEVAAVAAMPSGHFYSSPRGLMRLDGNLLDQDVYVAAADGMEFRIEQQIARAH